MRATLASLVLVAALGACAVQPVPTEGPGRSRPLQARITPSGLSGLGFHVSRQAHVALFEIVPGRGTSLVYPSPGSGRMDGFVFGGLHDLMRVQRYNSAQYLPAGAPAMAGPRFYFLVASESPLDLDRVGGFGMGLRSAMGMQFASYNAYGAMEKVASMVLPNSADDQSWTSDLYVYWPQMLYDTRRSGLVPLSCNGYSMYVPFEQLLVVREAICSADARSPVRPVPPGDSASAGEPGEVEPRRRGPVPRAAASAALRERITSSSQLERRDAVGTGVGRASESGVGGVREAAPRSVDVRARPGSRSGKNAGTRDRSGEGVSSEPRRATPASRPTVREPAARPPTRDGGAAPRAIPRKPGGGPPAQW